MWNRGAMKIDNFQIRSHLIVILYVVVGSVTSVFAQPAWQEEWERVKQAAKEEARLVVNISPNADLRKALESVFTQKFGIELELNLARSGTIARRVADEYEAGVRHFDILITTAGTLMDRLLPRGIIDPLETYWILPEVKDPKNWWGGHIWNDKAGRYAYSASAYMLDSVWYNADLVKPEEVRSYDDLLDPRWKGKLGLNDPRIIGAGEGMWGFLWDTKGEEYLTRLAQQLSVVAADRVVGDALARGKIAIAVGASFYSFQSFVKAGLPVKPLPPLKEGTYLAVGQGGPVVIKNPRHPNAAKVFVNWLLSREGQELYGKVHGHATRRLDVDTRWLTERGIRSAKDFLSMEQFYRYENQSETKILTVRKPARTFAQRILP
jgi:ABC-type Fe3+ transport system substrate-binding protein